jgi:hypothetical protein
VATRPAEQPGKLSLHVTAGQRVDPFPARDYDLRVVRESLAAESIE